MFHIVLYQPCIAPNTGNIIRLIANNGCKLHLIEPLGFDLDEKKVRRAGLDYHDLADVYRYENINVFLEQYDQKRLYLCTTKGQVNYASVQYQPEDIFLFGSETSGVPETIHQQIDDQQKIAIPMKKNNRSMNLANSVSIITYEAWRQNQFK